MSKVEHIEPLRDEVIRHLPEASQPLTKNIELIFKVLAALQTGTGDFSTYTAKGKRWTRVQDHEFPDET